MQIASMYAASAVEVAVVVAWKVIEGAEGRCRRVIALAHGVHGDITVKGGVSQRFLFSRKVER